MSVMRFQSTRDEQLTAGFGEALAQGLAPDGGLYVPAEWPHLEAGALTARESLDGIGAKLLAPFAAGDPLAAALPEITAEAFDFPAPVVALGAAGRLAVLELFHGPTAAFKDFGARFLAACLTRLRGAQSRPLTILVATSGDTGGAVAAAFHGRPGIEVAVLFPRGLVSPTQERQLTCWGGNVRSFAVRGTFDDCQRLVKQAFLDRPFREERALSSANSINLGRLLPQTVYYAAASLAVFRRHGERASFIVPSGNLGNAVACIWARRLGLPIGDVVLAHNANRTVTDFLESGEWRPRASIATLASAMDVGNPSNMERLRALHPQLSEIRSAVSACTVDDEAIRARIRTAYQELGQIWCPHTATAAEAYARLPPQRRDSGRWVLVSTAHPAKFREIVEPLIGREVPVPQSLARLFARPSECTEIDAELASLRAALRDGPISEGS
jgi:threonine synthase